MPNARILLCNYEGMHTGIMRRPFGKTPIFIMSKEFYSQINTLVSRNFSHKNDPLVKEMLDASLAHEEGHWRNGDLKKLFLISYRQIHLQEHAADKYAVAKGHAGGLKKALWENVFRHKEIGETVLYTNTKYHPSIADRLANIEKEEMRIKNQKYLPLPSCNLPS